MVRILVLQSFSVFRSVSCSVKMFQETEHIYYVKCVSLVFIKFFLTIVSNNVTNSACYDSDLLS